MPPEEPRARRELYSYEQLLPLIRPRSVAVVGASKTKDGFGTRALKRITESGFTGPVVAVSPRMEAGERLQGVPTVPSLRDMSVGVDCVMISVPAAGVEQVVLDAAETNCRSVIVFSAGFAEVSEEGRARQKRIHDIARAHDMRLGGPNTAGIINYRDGLPLTFVSDLAMDLPVGNLAIVSQSAGIATHLGHVRHRGTGISYTITTGNSPDVTALDYASFLLEDDATDVVSLVIEGLDDPAGFAAVGAKSRALGKPILLIKCGRTDAGGRAAVSHTGSLAGNYDVFLAAARQAGIQVLNTTEELVETASLFAKWAARPYRRGGVGVVTTMGGPGVMSADAAADAGVELPDPSPETIERLRELMPSFAAVSNPIDTTASPADPVLTEIIETIAADPRYAAIVMLAATMTGPSTAGRPAAIAEAAERVDTPVCAVWLSSWREGPGSELLDRHPRLPVFRSSDRCMRAIAQWIAWHETQAPATATPDPNDGKILDESQIAHVRALITKWTSPEGGALDEAQSRELLAACGINVPKAAIAHSPDDAVALAREIGLPVVAKVVSADVPHKAAAGGIALDLRSLDAVADAYRRIESEVGQARPDAHIEGVLIAEAVDTRHEFMCGLVRDDVIGAVVVCGAGGGAVEQIDDVAHVVAPVNDATAREALGLTRIIRRLRGTDPHRAASVESGLVDAMIRLAALAQIAPEIVEFDINPIVAGTDRAAVALDGLAVLAGTEWDQ